MTENTPMRFFFPPTTCWESKMRRAADAPGSLTLFQLPATARFYLALVFLICSH